jgi:hypothetical protein
VRNAMNGRGRALLFLAQRGVALWVLARGEGDRLCGRSLDHTITALDY